MTEGRARRACPDETVWALFTHHRAVWPLVWRHGDADHANYGIDRTPILVADLPILQLPLTAVPSKVRRMKRSTKTHVASPALGLASDWPPVGRFFMLFCALVALALGLAVLPEAGAASDEAVITEARAETLQQDSGR
jgi:hypothetical protein